LPRLVWRWPSLQLRTNLCAVPLLRPLVRPDCQSLASLTRLSQVGVATSSIPFARLGFGAYHRCPPLHPLHVRRFCVASRSSVAPYFIADTAFPLHDNSSAILLQPFILYYHFFLFFSLFIIDVLLHRLLTSSSSSAPIVTLDFCPPHELASLPLPELLNSILIFYSSFIIFVSFLQCVSSVLLFNAPLQCAYSARLPKMASLHLLRIVNFLASVNF
jgi:hypothetical protein